MDGEGKGNEKQGACQHIITRKHGSTLSVAIGCRASWHASFITTFLRMIMVRIIIKGQTLMQSRAHSTQWAKTTMPMMTHDIRICIGTILLICLNCLACLHVMGIALHKVCKSCTSEIYNKRNKRLRKYLISPIILIFHQFIAPKRLSRTSCW